jgi:hypothetical protein
MADEPDFNFTEPVVRQSSVLPQKNAGHIKCASCHRLVSKLSVVCPQCGGATHPKAAVPWLAMIVAAGVVAGAVWLTVDYIRTAREKRDALEILEKANQLMDRATKQK